MHILRVLDLVLCGLGQIWNLSMTTPLRRTLRVLLAFVVILCDTVNKMHFHRKDKCLRTEDVELAYSELNVVQHFLSLLTRHGVIFR